MSYRRVGAVGKVFVQLTGKTGNKKYWAHTFCNWPRLGIQADNLRRSVS